VAYELYHFSGDLLPDGPDEPTAAALTDDAEFSAIEQWATPEPRGMARSPFPEVGTGEDSRFVWSRGVRSVCDISDTDSLVALIHPGNTVPETVRSANWSRIPTEEVEELLGPDLPFYREQLNYSEIQPGDGHG